MLLSILLACVPNPSGAYVTAIGDIDGAWSTDVEDLSLDYEADPIWFACTATWTLEVLGDSFLYEYATEDCDPAGPYRVYTVCDASVPAEGLLVGTACINTQEATVDGVVEVSEIPSPELRFSPTILYKEGLLLRDLLLASVE